MVAAEAVAAIGTADASAGRILLTYVIESWGGRCLVGVHPSSFVWCGFVELRRIPKSRRSKQKSRYRSIRVVAAAIPYRPKDSSVSGSMEHSSNLGGVNSKNGSHSCPTANASQPGMGSPRGKIRSTMFGHTHRAKTRCLASTTPSIIQR